jgi:hypothetical protein
MNRPNWDGPWEVQVRGGIGEGLWAKRLKTRGTEVLLILAAPPQWKPPGPIDWRDL